MSKSDANHSGGQHLETVGRNLVHDIATPLATLQLNLQALTTYLPKLIAVYRKQTAEVLGEAAISPDHLAALGRLPDAIDGDIRRLRALTQAFLADITPSAVNVPSPDSPSSLVRRQQNMSRMLLVEDEEVHRQIALKQLANHYPLDVATSAAEATQLCNRHTYDLILLDFILPGMDGRDLISVIRQSASKNAVIFALSNMPIKYSEYREIGIQGFLEKPFRLKNFEEALIALERTEGRTSPSV